MKGSTRCHIDEFSDNRKPNKTILANVKQRMAD
jgi:hypothetical protein